MLSANVLSSNGRSCVNVFCSSQLLMHIHHRCISLALKCTPLCNLIVYLRHTTTSEEHVLIGSYESNKGNQITALVTQSS